MGCQIDPTSHDEIANRIHNDVAQALGAGMLQVEMCRRLLELGRAQELPEYLNQVHESIDTAVESLRRLIDDLRASAGGQDCRQRGSFQP